MSHSNGRSYAPIADYGLIADCHSAALVSSRGSIDWCCLPRVDAGSVFARLLDCERGGYCSIEPLDADISVFRDYMPDTLVLTTTFRVHGGEAQVWDCFLMPPDGHRSDDRRLLRVVEGRRGVVRVGVRVAPRFDYGDVKPWIRRHGTDLLSATGGDDALLVWSDSHLEPDDDLMHLEAEVVVRPGDRVRLLLTYRRPEQLEDPDLEAPQPATIDRALDETIEWWRSWSAQLTALGPDAASVRRSALVLKALAYPPTGAIAAAATTSLPEAPGAGRNWDYRYSWIRDSVLATRSLAHLGLGSEADSFRRFVERSTAGTADQLRVLYGIGGERRVPELDLGHLEGYRGARPVRVGNEAATQLQLDAYGQLVVQSWNWHLRGNSPDDDYWRFLVGLVDATVARWREPDAGIWEWRTGRKHFVHSKVLCWAATDLGLRLAEECTWSGRSTRSSRSSTTTGLSVATRSMMASPDARAPSSAAPSGWWRRWLVRSARKRRACTSTACLRRRTGSGCSPSSTTPPPVRCAATSRRR